MLTFPLDISADWHNNHNELNVLQKEWLLETGSLTAKLKQQFDSFRVEVLSEKKIELTQEQADVIGIQSQQALCREVVLYGNDKPRIYAQSWIPLAQLSLNSDFLTLGSKPLGEFIFQHPNLIRENLMLASFLSDSAIAPLLESLHLTNENVIARRSIFHLEELKLMVCEAFLPGAFN